MLRQATYTTPVTALYARLSKDDEQQGPSLSIENQKRILETFARDNGFLNCRFFVDDGWSGANFQRPGFMEMMDCVESGEVKCVITKDLSRMGRNYLQVGMFTEITFPKKGVRFIAINDGVDSAQGENDLTPLKNLFNEWMVRDTSKKIKAVKRAKGMSGKPTTTQPVYGYLMGEDERFIVDEEAAAVVKRIFALCAAGNGPSRIATILTKEKVFCPSYYTYQKYGLTHSALDITKPYHWSDSAVANLLENEIYLGNTVNYRFSTRSYKDERKMEHPREECLVFENTHPAIISKEVWDIVQRVRKNKRRRTKMDEQNKYSGLVICADCGKTMVLHRAHTMSADYNHFTCRTYKKDGEACTAHYIRECILDEIVLEDLRRVTAEAREHPQEFAEYLNSKQSAELQKEIRRLEKEKAAMQKRKAELDAIFKKLYEDSVLGRITAEQFQMLSTSYTEEQAKLTESLPQREAEIQRLKETVSNTAAFLDKAKRYTDIQALTPELLRLFIQKIVVHEKEVKWSKHAPQTVEIHYADIGCMENRQTAKPEQHKEIPKVS